MKIKQEFVTREVAGETILVPVGQAVLSLNGMLVLNECGRFLWDRLQTAESEERLTEALLEAYEVDRQTAEADVRDFLAELRRLGIL